MVSIFSSLAKQNYGVFNLGYRYRTIQYYGYRIFYVIIFTLADGADFSHEELVTVRLTKA
ncbi:hypothetical protein C1634_003285 [Chryseobacterium viscerum]|uniref:Uncharacterized protein n=1 Tax=Chryseobacterium viscerum TaxID=1037377 RepID=A0A316X4N7_9FLAO|nr:hypothetical protein C1634_003285 [Chryseobacterium viscerum]